MRETGGLILRNDSGTAYNTAYTLQANALALRDIAPLGRNVVYAENVCRITMFKIKKFKKKGG